MKPEYTRLPGGHEATREAGSCLGASSKPSGCVTLLAVLGCLTFLGVLLAVAVLERPAEPRDNATLPGEPGGSADDQWR